MLGSEAHLVMCERWDNDVSEKETTRQGAVAPASQHFGRPRGGRSVEVRSLRPAWTAWRKPVSIKNKISLAWWHVPVIAAAREAEAGESLEPGRRRLH